MKLYKLLVFITLITVLHACKKENSLTYYQYNGNVFGTTYKIVYETSKAYQTGIDSVFLAVNKSLSTYLPTSDISKINKGDTTVVVDALFAEVFKKSKRIYKETQGFFDPTVGNLVNAYGFGAEKLKKNLTTEEISSLMKFVGFDKVNLKDGKISKQFSETYLDFNSIAKGYGVDLVSRFLESKNCKNYLVEIGGEIRCRGVNSKKKIWKIAIEEPNTDGTRSISNYVNLDNKSMAGSGNYRKFKINKNDKKFVHTINPKTGEAKENNLLSAFVIAPIDCADVDAYATAFMAMGFEKTKLFLKNNPKIDAFLIYVSKKGVTKNYKTF